MTRPIAICSMLLLLAGSSATGAADAMEQRELHHPDGSLRAQWAVRITEQGQELRHGRFVRYHPNGQPALVAWYQAGEPTGEWRWWDERGRFLRSVEHQFGDAIPKAGEAFTRPTIAFTRPDGRKTSEGLLKHDQPHGLWHFWYADGSPRAEGTYLTGVPDGRWIFFYPDGQIEREEHYQMGVLHGEFREGFPNGQEKRAGNLDQGLKDGEWRFWYPDGKLKALGTYTGDHQDGEWRFWDGEGRMTSRATYRAGRLLDRLEILPEHESPPPIVVTEDDLLPLPTLFDEDGLPIQPKE